MHAASAAEPDLRRYPIDWGNAAAFIETVRLVAVMTVQAHQSFSYSATVAVADLEVSVWLSRWTCGRAAGLSFSRMAWNVT